MFLFPSLQKFMNSVLVHHSRLVLFHNHILGIFCRTFHHIYRTRIFQSRTFHQICRIDNDYISLGNSEMRLILLHRSKPFLCSRFYNHILSNFGRIFHILIRNVDHICHICTYQIQILYRIYRIGNDHISLGNSEMHLVLLHRNKPFDCGLCYNHILSNFGRIFHILIRNVDHICRICTYQIQILYRIYRIGNDHISLGNSEMRLVLPHRNKPFDCGLCYNHILSNFGRIFHILIRNVDHICRICTYQIQILYRIYRIGNDHISLGNSEMRLVLPHRNKPFDCGLCYNHILSNFGRIFHILIRNVDHICHICTYQIQILYRIYRIGNDHISLGNSEMRLVLPHRNKPFDCGLCYNHILSNFGRIFHILIRNVDHICRICTNQIQIFYRIYRIGNDHISLGNSEMRLVLPHRNKPFDCGLCYNHVLSSFGRIFYILIRIVD